MIGQTQEQGWNKERLVAKVYSHCLLHSGFYGENIAWAFRALDRRNKMTKHRFLGSTVAKPGWEPLQQLDEDIRSGIDKLVLRHHYTLGSIEATLETAEIAAVEQTIQEQILEGILDEDEEDIDYKYEGLVARAREVFDAIYGEDYYVDWEERDDNCKDSADWEECDENSTDEAS